MVVSEITERLSPNIAPPTTVPIHRGSDSPPFVATTTAMGARTVMVPTLVPIAIEIRQAIMKRPGTANLAGRILSSILAVLTAPPAALAMPLNAPANRNMRSIVVILSSPIPWAQM